MASLPKHLMPGPVGREQLPRKVVTEHQRKRALTAAIEVFAERGYSAATVDDLVAASQVGVGSFYALFGGKEECLLEAYEEIVDTGRAAMREAAEGGDTWGERIYLGLRELLNLVAAQPGRAKVALVEAQTAGPEAVARYEQMLDEVAAQLREGRRYRADAIQGLPESLERSTASGVAWLLNRRLALGEADSIPSLLPELAELVLEPYLGAEGARDLAATDLVRAS